jgi:hypothetical protein
VLKRIVDFEVAPPTPAKDGRTLVALVASAILHVAIILLLIFGIPMSSAASLTPVPVAETSQPIALQPPGKTKPLPKLAAKPPENATQPPPPPPPMKEVELGPDSKKPDAPAKEAAAKQSDADAAAAKAKLDEPPPTPAPDQPKPAAQPPAPQKLQVPKPGDYTGTGGIPLPTTSPWGPPKLDAASGDPPSEPERVSSGTMGRTGLSAHDPSKWENSFDNETSGQCPTIPELGKNPDGSPVLAAVIGRVLAPDGHTPMGSAHLQIQGTQYNTFSDNSGEYHLAFDPHMLAKCRKQYVVVDAPGYATQVLTLMIGPRVRSDDVVMHHH